MEEYERVWLAVEVPGSARAATKRTTYSLLMDYDEGYEVASRPQRLNRF
jgi:hypothetical protein